MTLKEKFITAISYLLHPKKRKLIIASRKFKSKIGLEIGGPSPFFSIRSYFPLYLSAKKIDGVNFSNDTVWEGHITEGENFAYYPGKKGYQYISEASDLSKISDNKYDFVASCHCLEHAANPLKALSEWNRVTKSGGYLVLILPDRKFTFDDNRPLTTFEHLKSDLDNNVGENDTTHFEEVIELHDLGKDDGVKNRDELIERTNNNFINRCVHHHTFDFNLITQMLNYTGFSVVRQQWVHPFNLVTVAKKLN